MGTYRQPGQKANFFNPAEDILVGIESVERDVTDRMKTVRDFENAAAVRRADMLNALADTEGMDDMGAVDSLQASLMKQVDDLYKLDIASFEGDRSEYLRKQNETNNIVKNIPALMGLIDAEGEAYKKAENSGTAFIKKILRTNNQDYINFVDNASKGGDKISFRIQNGNIIAQYDGKDVFNGNAYIKAKKDGVDLVNYAGDYSKEIGEADKRAYQNLDNLVKVQSIQKEIDKGKRLNTQQIKDYTEAKAEYTKRLEEGVLVDALLNESTYQTFTNYGSDNNLEAWKNDETQRGATKQAIIDYMVEQRFPGSAQYVVREEEKESQTKAQKIAAYERRKARKAKEAEAELNRINKAKNEVERRKAVDFYLDRNMKHADDVDKLEAAGKNQQAQELRVKLLNEARGVEKTPFSALQGTIDNEGKFSPSDDSGEYFIVDDKLQLVEGVEDGVGLIDALNSETVYRDLNARYKSEIKSYVTNRMAQRSLSKPSQNKSVANASSLPKAY